ncbi:hypothetical protein HC931_15570 [Candidatus Gracilibacteria bacterium]|nr:hypothetical protein [Candidatus Gracilibacteria bacterium]NJM86949.1 hypothetical protein [Hydrococcus sp. RU_2_2]NJP19017.1 hypothetical protein [Hydrococcus sp. CRU_1_1]
MLYLWDLALFWAVETRNCLHCIALVEFSSNYGAIAQLDSQIVLSFQTKTYTIKIYRQESRLLMDVYNKKTSDWMLNGALVETASSPDGTSYWHREKGKFIFRVYQRTDGRKWIIINSYGQAFDEIWEGEI